jgi:hypothetical protein
LRARSISFAASSRFSPFSANMYRGNQRVCISGAQSLPRSRRVGRSCSSYRRRGSVSDLTVRFIFTAFRATCSDSSAGGRLSLAANKPAHCSRQVNRFSAFL